MSTHADTGMRSMEHIWGAGWALWARLLLVGLIAMFTLVAFSPRQGG